MPYRFLKPSFPYSSPRDKHFTPTYAYQKKTFRDTTLTNVIRNLPLFIGGLKCTGEEKEAVVGSQSNPKSGANP